MKSFKLIIPLSIIAMFTLLSATLRSNGSPGKQTGSPLDGSSCVQCHVGSATSSVNWITTTIPESGYIPGETYEITAEATGSTPRIGFEITAENNAAKQGSFAVTDNSRTKLADGTRAITHTISGITPSGGKNTWNMNWTAPAEGTGEVTFYAAFNVANGNGNTSGDQIFTSALKVAENVSTEVDDIKNIPFTISPNPSNGSFVLQAEEQIIAIEAYNLSGKKVATVNNVNAKTWQMNLADNTSGIYIVKIQTTAGQFVQKVHIK